MAAAESKRAVVVWGAGLFCYGALVHLLLLELCLCLSNAKYNAGLLGYPLAAGGVAAVGGACTCFFMSRLLRRVSLPATSNRMHTLSRAGWREAAVTVCTFEMLFLGISLYSALSVLSFDSPDKPPAFLAVAGAFAFSFLATQLYGTFYIAACLPFSFAAGIPVGLAIWRKRTEGSASAPNPASGGAPGRG